MSCISPAERKISLTKVAYLWCDFPGMPELALTLRDSVGWEPVLFLGHPHLAEPLAESFPGTPWQTIMDAHLGRPIEGVNSTQPHALDAALWNRLQHYLPRLMNQMNRYGPTDHFLYDEREAFARNLLMNWHEALNVTGAEVVFFEETPSNPCTYAAYIVCRELGIPTVALWPTKAAGLTLLREGIEQPALRLAEIYEHCLHHPSDDELPCNVNEAISSVVGHDGFQHYRDMALAERERMLCSSGTRNALTAQARPAATRAERLQVFGVRSLRALKVWRWPLYLSNAFLRRAARQQATQSRRQTVVPSWFKLAGARIGSEWTGEDATSHRAKRTRIKEQLRANYEQRCVEPDYSEDMYVFFPLHYRPERTTNPDGGVFYDQFIPLAMVSEALPDGWRLYVKEHPIQFAEVMFGECGRTIDFYEDIARLRGVQFIASDASSKQLTQHAQAVASITGTVCWEAALLGKPAMYFGFPWYQGCPGTVQVGSAEQVHAVLGEPQAVVASEHQLLEWHRALNRAGFPYEVSAWANEPGRFTDEEQYAGLLSALLWWHHNRYSNRLAGQSDER